MLNQAHMRKIDFVVTFACYNQVEYTRLCIDSMLKNGFDMQRLVVVDNASTDQTRTYLETLPLGGRIFNKANLGCGVAWNQGALALQAEWTIVMNNDVIVSAGWIESLIHAAEQNGLKVVSPSLIEGDFDYDFELFARNSSEKMRDALRLGDRHAVCLAVHESVWRDIGYFQPIPKLLGYEDTMFFHECDKSGIPTGITGASWLHHFGSITQTAMKLERGLSAKDGLANRYNYRLLQQSWMERKLKKIQRIRQKDIWCRDEVSRYGMSMHGLRKNSEFTWK